MSFNIIHHPGQVNQAITLKGQIITRQESLFIPEWGMLVPCAPYEEHFIYENPGPAVGGSIYLCTCGSIAQVANPGAPDALFVCMFHVNHGIHATSVVNVKDFDKVAGQTIEPKSRKWLI